MFFNLRNLVQTSKTPGRLAPMLNNRAQALPAGPRGLDRRPGTYHPTNIIPLITPGSRFSDKEGYMIQDPFKNSPQTGPGLSNQPTTPAQYQSQVAATLIANTPAQTTAATQTPVSKPSQVPALNWQPYDYANQFQAAPGAVEAYLTKHPGVYDIQNRLAELDPVQNKSLYDAYRAKEQELGSQDVFGKIWSKDEGYNPNAFKNVQFFDLAKFEEGLLNQAKQSNNQSTEQPIFTESKSTPEQQAKTAPFQEALNAYKDVVANAPASTATSSSTTTSSSKPSATSSKKPVTTTKPVLQKSDAFQNLFNERTKIAQAPEQGPAQGPSEPRLRGQSTPVRYDPTMRMMVPMVPAGRVLNTLIRNA